MRRLVFWVGQYVDVAEYVRTGHGQTCQRTKAAHGGPRGLIPLLPLLTRRVRMIGVDGIACLQTTAAGFGMIQNNVTVDLFSAYRISGKVHAVPTRATATAADAAEIIR